MDGKIYIAPNKPVVKSWVPYIVAILEIAVILFLLVTVVFQIITKSTKYLVADIIVLTVFCIIHFILNNFFSWFESGVLEKEKDILVYSEFSPLDALGRNKYIYKFKNIDSVKASRFRVTITGEIDVREPLRKPYTTKRIELERGIPDLSNLLKEYIDKS